MNVHSPQKNYFELASKYRLTYKSIFWLTIVFSIVSNFAELGNIDIYVTVISIASLFSLDYIINHFVFKAEEVRRFDYFDNSFGRKYSSDSSLNYYDTDEIDVGLYKMIVNTFESSMFSMEISKKMKEKSLIRNLIFSIIIISFAIYGFSRTNISIPILQLFLSKDFIVDLININTYNSRVEKVYNNLKQLFDRGLQNTKASIDNNLAEIIRIYMEYETNISDMKIPLDSKIYNSMNDDLTSKWNDIKIRYSIK